MQDDDIAQGAFDTAKCVVVEPDLAVASCICDHQLDRVAVPCAVSGVFVVLVCNDKSEINVFIVVDNPHCRSVIVGPCPVAALPELKVDEFLIFPWAIFWFPESRICDHVSS